MFLVSWLLDSGGSWFIIGLVSYVVHLLRLGLVCCELTLPFIHESPGLFCSWCSMLFVSWFPDALLLILNVC